MESRSIGLRSSSRAAKKAADVLTLPAPVPTRSSQPSKGRGARYERASGLGGRPTELQQRFPDEHFPILSPLWGLDWCRPLAELEKEDLVMLPSHNEPYNGVTKVHWDQLRRDVVDAYHRARQDDQSIVVEKINTNHHRQFVYAPCVSEFCLRHELITHGPWVPFVKRALGVTQVEWANCMGIYALVSLPGSLPLEWHTDFFPEHPDPQRDELLHKIVNVLVPMQDLTAVMGHTVVLDRDVGRRRLEVTEQGHWYAIDPGYPHAADGYYAASGEIRMMLNISYIHPAFSAKFQRHVISFPFHWKNHLSGRMIAPKAGPGKRMQASRSNNQNNVRKKTRAGRVYTNEAESDKPERRCQTSTDAKRYQRCLEPYSDSLDYTVCNLSIDPTAERGFYAVLFVVTKMQQIHKDYQAMGVLELIRQPSIKLASYAAVKAEGRATVSLSSFASNAGALHICSTAGSCRQTHIQQGC